MFKNLLLFSLLVSGKEAVYLLPNSVTNITKEIASQLVKNTAIDAALFKFGNQLIDLVDTVTKERDSNYKSKSTGRDVLSLPASRRNVLEELDKFVIEYKAENVSEGASMPAADILAKYGYPVEKHEVTTEDGYILTMFRIPSNGTPVLLLHGLVGSSDDFVVAGPENALSYLLADKGYDVWMGNARGTKHSRRHTTMKPSSANFWDFSWHEIGIYDLPAMIDYILIKSNKQSLKYIGHSQGNTVFFVMASEKPEYNEKVSLVISLSPVVYMAHLKSPVIRLLVPETTVIYELLKSFGIYEFLPDNKLIRNLKTLVCGWGPLLLTFCDSLLFLGTGFDFGQIDVDNLPVVFGHIPSGASVKQIAHYAQTIMSRGFRKFDYGESENKNRYGIAIPPSYNLSRITTPVCLMYSEGDWLADPKDVQHLRKKLKNVPEVYKVPYEQFNHVDFLLAKDVKELVYNKLLSMLRKY